MPPTRRAARRVVPASASSAPAAPTRRQLRDAASAPAAWQPASVEPQRITPPTVQVEVVKPVVAEPSSPRMVEPALPASVVATPQTPPAPNPVPVEPIAAKASEAVAPRLTDPAATTSAPASVAPPASTAPAATRRRRRTPAASRPDVPTEPRVEQPAPALRPPVEPRIEAPRVTGIDEPIRIDEPVAARTEPPAPPRVEPPVSARVEEPASPRVDEFERAARLFSFTGENPTVSTAPAAPVAPVASPTETAAPRTRRARRITAASLSLAAIGAVGLLTVGMTLPTEAVAAATGTADVTQLAGDVHDGGDGDIQAYVASSSGAGAVQGSLQRTSGFTTGTEVQLAGTAGISNVSGSSFSNNQNCPVQWPFAVGVPITYGFGPRPGEFHEGVDFTPGYGAHIQAIADGVVVVAQNSYQGYGTAVIIDHVVNGQRIASLYGHMELGSLQVRVGQKVKVGQYIGRTGNTGHSFGAHTHLEIRQNDVTPIDPLPWLRSHNQC